MTTTTADLRHVAAEKSRLRMVCHNLGARACRRSPHAPHRAPPIALKNALGCARAVACGRARPPAHQNAQKISGASGAHVARVSRAVRSAARRAGARHADAGRRAPAAAPRRARTQNVFQYAFFIVSNAMRPQKSARRVSVVPTCGPLPQMAETQHGAAAWSAANAPTGLKLYLGVQ